MHATEADAEKEVMMILEFYRQLIEEQMAIPVLLGYKSDSEKFVGAKYTTTLEAMMPDGKAIQMGTSHHLGQNFAKPFEIKYLGQDEQPHYAWTTSWGVSWRMIGALIMLHGDDKGLVLPPRIAPIQVVIVPILYKTGDSKGVTDKASKLGEILRRSEVAVRVDAREQYTPGWKFNEWELKGVPLRIEVGPRDLEKHQVTLVRRDTGAKEAVSDEAVVPEVGRVLDDIQRNLFARAKSALDASISESKEYDQFKKAIDGVGGFVRASWCGETDCEQAIKADTGATIRTLPLTNDKPSSGCVRCGRPGAKVAYFARSY